MSNHLVITRQCESLGGLVMSSHQVSSEELNPFEQEVVSKFDNIINTLHELEEQFSQARQEVLRKSSLEGKENGKICAIKGRVITSKKKYYRSLEGDMQGLDKVFQEQFAKIYKDFSSLKAASGIEEKPEVTPKDSANYPVMPPTSHPDLIVPDITSSSPFVKSVALPSIKKIESGKKPTPSGMTPKLVRTPLFRANTVSEIEVPKRLDFDKAESIPNPYNIRHLQRDKENIPIPEDPLNIPEEESEVENEDNNRAVQRVRLGLLKEIQSSQPSKTPKPVKSQRGHGFRLSQGQPVSDGRGMILEPSISIDDKCNA